MMDSRFPYLSRTIVKEAFHDPRLLMPIWGENWGVDNPAGHIRRVLMHRPGEEVMQLHDASPQIESGPMLLGRIKGKIGKSRKPAPPNLKLLQKQHQSLVTALEKEGAHVVFLENDAAAKWPEALFTRDLGMVVPGGVILSRLALHIRYGETKLAAGCFARADMPILGAIQGHGFVEGGSFEMLDKHTALIGRSERVNAEGIHQLKQLLSFQGIDLIEIDLPASIIHLDEAFLMVDAKKALVNISLLPFWFLEELHHRNIELLHVDPRDPALTINALCVSPGRVVCSSEGKYTADLLSRNGLEVIPVEVSEIEKLGGGIHCCTLPLIRDSLPS